MTAPTSLDEDALANSSTAEIHSALFDQLVTGHGQMALLFLGKLPNPQTNLPGEVNMVAAKIFIDQLEMLEAKTKGNLTPDETRLLSQTLNLARMAFVEMMEAQASEDAAAAPAVPSAKQP